MNNLIIKFLVIRDKSFELSKNILSVNVKNIRSFIPIIIKIINYIKNQMKTQIQMKLLQN